MGPYLGGVGGRRGELEVQPVFLARAFRLPRGFQCDRQIVVGLGEVRLKADSFLELPNGARQLIPALERARQAQMSIRLPGALPQILLVVGDGLVQVAFLSKRIG